MLSQSNLEGTEAYQELSLPEGQVSPGFDWDGYEDEDAAYWRDLPDGGLVGRLFVESAGIDHAVVKGDSVANLRRGPAWMTGTDFPGPTGNTGLAGHRTTFGAPFSALDRVEEGDTIIVVSPYRTYSYTVDSVSIVLPTDVQVIDTTDDPRITLIACHPRFSARQRLVVQAALTSVVRSD